MLHLSGAAVLTAGAVCAVGVVGFVGLVAPTAPGRSSVAGTGGWCPCRRAWEPLLVSVADTLGRTVIAQPRFRQVW